MIQTKQTKSKRKNVILCSLYNEMVQIYLITDVTAPHGNVHYKTLVHCQHPWPVVFQVSFTEPLQLTQTQSCSILSYQITTSNLDYVYIGTFQQIVSLNDVNILWLCYMGITSLDTHSWYHVYVASEKSRSLHQEKQQCFSLHQNSGWLHVQVHRAPVYIIYIALSI